MANFPKAANGIISEVDGPYYPVKFDWVPRVGELIDLTSFLEIKASPKNEFRFSYEVLAVVHIMHDVVEGVDRPHIGHHNLRVIVKRSSSKHLES